MAKQAVFEPITPAHARALTRRTRKRIENTVEHLIAVLDAADGDPDLEADNADDEPWLARTEGGEMGGGDDREADYATYPGGTCQVFTADMEPDIEADREPRLPPFELNQAQEGRP